MQIHLLAAKFRKSIRTEWINEESLFTDHACKWIFFCFLSFMVLMFHNCFYTLIHVYVYTCLCVIYSKHDTNYWCCHLWLFIHVFYTYNYNKNNTCSSSGIFFWKATTGFLLPVLYVSLIFMFQAGNFK